MPKNETKKIEDVIEDLKKIIEDKTRDVKKVTDWLKERRGMLENSNLLALGVAFTIGLAIGVAISKEKK